MVTVNIEIVEGRGTLQASRNGSIVAVVNPGDGIVPVQYNVGDTFFFYAYPDTQLGFSFNKFCADTGCSLSTTSNPFSGTISQDGYLGVYFSGTQATITVYIQNNVGGTVDVYRNTRKVTTVTTSQTINFFINDVFSFVAKPSSGYSFSKYCTDASCSQSTTGNPFTGTVTQPSGNLYAIFTSSGGGGCVPPCPAGYICQGTTCVPTGGGGGGGTTCDPVTCPSDKNFCVLGSCVPKTYVVYAGAGIVALFLLKMIK
ncbi:MAG: hypothetical protein PHP08_00350 [Candidatus Dojkabacteria bacterium]|nr:hypothetical protein [Candidatus Dojkabacteria bacterium]